MSDKKCSCGCQCSGKTSACAANAEKAVSLADLPVGSTATIVKVIPESRGRKKFADVGLVQTQRLHKYIKIRLIPTAQKADLNTSRTMQRLLSAKES